MPQAEIHGSDIGLVISVTVKDSDGVVVDISGAVLTEFYLLKPPDTVLTKAAVFGVGAGVDGILQYTTIAGDLDVAGRWKLQAHISDATTDVKTNITEFDVYGNLA